MRKTSELLRLTKTDPRYLVEQYYLCSIVSRLLWERVISADEYNELGKTIYGSLGGAVFLRTLLRNNGTIAHTDDERSPGYAVHAHAHWDMLIAEHESKGN